MDALTDNLEQFNLMITQAHSAHGARGAPARQFSCSAQQDRQQLVRGTRINNLWP